MALEHHNAAGLFSSRQQVESALGKLKAAGFSMDKVSVVHQPDTAIADSSAAEQAIETLTGSDVLTETEFERDRNLEPIEHGALGAGLWGALGGGLLAGLSAIALPTIGAPVVLVGLAAGGFYGAVSGGLIGGATGVGLSDEKAKYYDRRLDEGNYLVMVTGSEDEVAGAKSVLEDSGIQGLTVFEAL